MNKTIDKDGLLLAKIQGDIFLKSLNETNSSSDVFIRRYINSNIVKSMDSKAFLDESITVNEVFNELNNEYGASSYGKNKYSKEAIYWIGYIYRYISYLYGLSSKQTYNIIKPSELNEMYYVYHTLDCSLAINNILEEKNISFNKDDLNKKLLYLLKIDKYENELSLNLINDKNKLLFNISYNKYPSIGNVNITKTNDDKYYEINIFFNNDRYKNNELIITLLNKLINYLSVNLNNKIVLLLFKINKDDEELIFSLKKLGFKYFGENDNLILVLLSK